MSSFRFNVPLEITKSDEKGWYVKGLASTDDKDLQNEIVKQDGLDISVLKSGRGLFNYEHKNDPENIVGAIEDANVTKDGLHVEGYLFKKHKRAQAIAEIMQSLHKDQSKRVQLSIEGNINERADENNKIIKKAKVDKVAITFEPVNRHTYLGFAKSLVANGDQEKAQENTVLNGSPEIGITDDTMAEIEEAKKSVEGTTLQTEIINDETKLAVAEGQAPMIVGEITEHEPVLEKTMTAGGGDAAPAARVDGAALQPEEVDSKKKNLKSIKRIPRHKKKSLLYRSIKKALVAFPCLSFEVVAESVRKSIDERFPDGYHGEVRLIDDKPYILEPNDVWSPLGGE